MSEQVRPPIGKWPMTGLAVAISLFAAVLQPHSLSVEGLIADVTVWSVLPLIVLWFGKTSSGRNAGAITLLAAIIFFASIGSGLIPLGR